MTTSYISGIICGIAIVVLVTFLMRRLSHDNASTKYDEMQERARGIAYKYAFWTVAMIEALLGVLELAEFYEKFPLNGFMLHFTILLIGIMVQVCYSIWHHAYIGLNTNVRKYVICCSLLSLFNFLVAVKAIMEGEMIVDGQLQFPFISLLCALMFVIIGVLSVIRNRLDQKED